MKNDFKTAMQERLAEETEMANALADLVTPRYPDIHVQLTGLDGNIFTLMGAVTAAMRRAGVPNEEIIELREHCMSGDYDHALRALMQTVDIS
jgi:hypothetical protein